jgi:DNA-binding SARP family transcriptional activator
VEGILVSKAVRLGLLGTFSLVHEGQHVDLPPSGQRLVAFLALQDGPLLRARVAGTLWPESSDEHAHASLRSALWRVHRSGCEIVAAIGARVALAAGVDLDVRSLTRLAHDVVNDARPLPTDVASLVGELSADLLPDWYEDWIVIERQQLEHLRLHALEALAERLLVEGRIEEAGEAALAGVAVDPLRESTHRALIRVHLAEGNVAVALRRYAAFRSLSKESLGVPPSPRMEELIRPVTER